MKRRANPEAQIQRSLIQYLRLRGKPGIVFWHTPNGGKRDLIEAANLKRLGVRAGVADLCILHDGKFFALELKADGGRLTEHQIAFMSEVNEAGGFSACAEGIDAALRIVKQWNLVS